MQVRPEDVPIDRAFASVLAVVAEPGDNAAERLNAVAQKGPPSVVLEADDSRSVPFDDDVPDEALRLGAGVDRVQIQDLGAGELLTFGGPVETAHELIAPADGQHGDVPLDGLPERFGLDLYQVLCDQALLPVLCAAHEDEIVILGLERIAELEAIDLKGDASSLTAALETKDVAAVAVDVHELRKQVSQAERESLHSASEKAPRPAHRASRSRTSSIAVYVGITESVLPSGV